MVPYSPLAYRPYAAPSPHGGRLGQTFDQMLGLPEYAGDLIRLGFHGATTYFGLKVALEEGGTFMGIVGWILGVGNGIGALCDAISLLKRAAGTHPAGREECPVP